MARVFILGRSAFPFSLMIDHALRGRVLKKLRTQGI